MSRYRSLVLLGVVALASISPSRAGAAIFRVGSGAGCTHFSVQSAVNAARNAPGFDTIRITHSLNYIAQGIVIRDQDVQLVGGYIDCRSEYRDGLRHSTLSGAGDTARSVIQVAGWGSVVLSNLELRDGDDVGSGDQHGGGLDIIGGPHAVVLQDVLVVENQAGRGGGVSIRNDFSTMAADSTLSILGDTSIDANASSTTGGGIFCANATVTMRGPRNRIWSNTAAWAGGGVRAENCRAKFGSPSGDPARGTISFNTAHDGGGLSAGGGDCEVTLYQTDSSAPFAMYRNRARGQGGAVEAESGARVFAYDALLLENTAEGGGGAARVVQLTGSPAEGYSTTVFAMSRDLRINGIPSPGVPFGAVNCKPSLACNRIAGNFAISSTGALVPGAAIVLLGDPEGSSGLPMTEAHLRGTTVRDNIGSSLFEFTPTHSSARLGLDATVIVRNTSLRPLINNPQFAFDAYVYANGTTISDNKISDQVVFGMSDDSAILHRSIIHQPYSRTLGWIDGAIDPQNFEYLLAMDLTGLPDERNLVLTGDPGFVDPANGNYRLRVDSPAVDFAMPHDYETAGEADGATRVVDLPDVANRFGSLDLGAYERKIE